MLIVVIIWISVEPFRVPSFCRRLIEIRIRKKSQADDSGAIAIIGAHRHIFSPGADLYSWIFLLILERIGGTIFAASVEPKTETIGSPSLRLLKAGFVHHSEIFPARVPAEVLDLQMRRNDRYEIHRAK